MKSGRIVPSVCLTAMWALAGAAFGQDTSATTSGNWEDSTTWSGGVPQWYSTVYIGSTSPGVATATVTLQANEQASNVNLGNGSGTSGTLNLNGNALTAYGTLTIGSSSGGTGAINESNGGSFSAVSMNVYGPNSVSFGAGDSVTYLNLYNGASATTSAAGNTTDYIGINSGSTLTLGAATTYGNTIVVGGAGSTLNLNGYALSADSLNLGNSAGAPVNLERGGATATIATDVLTLTGGTQLQLIAGDQVGSFTLTGSDNASQPTTLTTAATANVTFGGTVGPNAQLNLGAAMNVGANSLVIDGGGTLNMNGDSVTAGTLVLGSSPTSLATLENRGTLDVNELLVYQGSSQTFNLNAKDQVTTFSLVGGQSTLYSGVTNLYLSDGASVTTTATGNIGNYGSVVITSGSTLTAGAALNVGYGAITVDGAGSTLNLNGYSLSAYGLYLGDYGGSPVNLVRGGATGTIDVSNLTLTGGTQLQLIAGDQVGSFSLTGSDNASQPTTLTTTTTGNVTGTGYDTINTNAVLNMGADLNLGSSDLSVEGGTLNMEGHSLTAGALTLEESVTAATVINSGTVNLGSLYLYAASATILGGSVVNDDLDLEDDSTLTVKQVDEMGLTYNGSGGDLYIDPSSIVLDFTGAGWDLKLSDANAPSGGWVQAIDTMITDGQIVIETPQGYSYKVIDNGTFTYVEDFAPAAATPEPSSFWLACVVGGGGVLGAVWRRRRAG